MAEPFDWEPFDWHADDDGGDVCALAETLADDDSVCSHCDGGDAALPSQAPQRRSLGPRMLPRPKGATPKKHVRYEQHAPQTPPNRVKYEDEDSPPTPPYKFVKKKPAEPAASSAYGAYVKYEPAEPAAAAAAEPAEPEPAEPQPAELQPQLVPHPPSGPPPMEALRRRQRAEREALRRRQRAERIVLRQMHEEYQEQLQQ